MSPDPIGINKKIQNHGYASAATYLIDPLGLSLRTNIKAAGGGVSGQWQAHHIIPTQIWNDSSYSPMFRATGLGRNAATNGIALPSTDSNARTLNSLKHSGPHPNYSNAVKEDVEKVNKKWCKDKNSKSALVRAAADAKAAASLRGIQEKYRSLIKYKGAAMPGTPLNRAGW